MTLVLLVIRNLILAVLLIISVIIILFKGRLHFKKFKNKRDNMSTKFKLLFIVSNSFALMYAIVEIPFLVMATKFDYVYMKLCKKIALKSVLSLI